MTIRYQSDLGESHWTTVKNILKYFRRSKATLLLYGGQEDVLVVNGYTYASFQSKKDDFKSQSCLVVCLNEGAISSKSSKQDIVADSTIEAEYIAASEAAKEVVWIKKFIIGLGVIPSISNPMDLFCDNNGAIAQDKIDHTKDLNTFLDIFTSFERLLTEEKSRYAEYLPMTTLQIH